MKQKINIFILIIPILFLSRCANPVGPTGGDKDTQAPKIKTIKISKEENTKHITIFFDENINVKGNPLVSPQVSRQTVSIEKERTSITLKVNDKTNSVQLLDIISDVNENNVGNYPAIILGKDSSKYVFKYKSKEKQKIKGFTASDSNIYPANNSFKGRLVFEGIPKESKELVIYDDLNNNDKYELIEPYHIHNPIKLYNYNDTLKDTLNIELNRPYKSELKYFKDSNRNFTIILNLPYKYTNQYKNIYCHLDTCICSNQDFNTLHNKLKEDNRIISIEQKIQIPKTGYFILSKNLQGNKKDIIVESTINQIIEQKNNPNNEYAIDSFQNINLINTNFKSSLNKDSLIKIINREYGTLHIENKTNKLLIAELLNERKLKYYLKLNPGDNEFNLESSIYKTIIWDDSINPNYRIDLNEPLSMKTQLKEEKIYKNNLEITVNSKIENTITINDN